MPITAYADGSGLDDLSAIKVLAVCVIENRIIEPFNQRWNEVLKHHGLTALHMREVGAERNFNPRQRMLCDLLNAGQEFTSDSFYLRTCSVVTADYNAAKQTRVLRTPEELCVDFCLGALKIPAADAGQCGTVSVKFDRNEPFLRLMDRTWRRARKNPRSGWPRQVEDIEAVSADVHPAMQAADMVAWALNRQQTRKDEPLLFSASFMNVRHQSCIWSGNPDFASGIGNLQFG